MKSFTNARNRLINSLHFDYFKKESMKQEFKTDKLATTDWVADNLNNATVRIIEIGDLKNPGAYYEGHIPGARHLYYVHLLNDDETFKPMDSLRQSYSSVGATPDKELVFYCRLSHRGTLGWFIARHILGYPRAKVYDGSWTEWGSMVGMPIVNESLAM